MRDFQRQRVYDWENKHIRKKVSTKLADLEFIRKIVNYIWNDLGYELPPEVVVNKSYKTKSTGNRYEIKFMPSMVNEFTAIHELAHSINMRYDFVAYDSHGPNYVADYCFLLNHYYKVDEFYLIGTLKESGVKINLARFYQHKTKHERKVA